MNKGIKRNTISIAEFARQEKIGISTAYKAARNGDIPVIKIGNRILVSVPAWRQMLSIDEPNIIGDGNV